MTAVEAPNDRDRISPAADGARSRAGGEHGQDGPWKESIRADPARPRRLPRPAAGSRHGGPAQPARSRPIASGCGSGTAPGSKSPPPEDRIAVVGSHIAAAINDLP